MFSSLGTKLAMKKLGLPSDLTKASPFGGETTTSKKKGGASNNQGVDDLDDGGNNAMAWPKWMSVKNLPLTVQPWFSPVPPPVPVAAECPKAGEPAPVDQDKKLVLGDGRKVIVVFLRCVGCACKSKARLKCSLLRYLHPGSLDCSQVLSLYFSLVAQKTFLTLRALANKHQFHNLTCIAISHSSQAATQKWLDLIGGAWNVQVLIDEDRAIYAAWGLGLGSVWYYFNPATQTAAWKEKGWLGARVATSIQRKGTVGNLDSAAPATTSATTTTKNAKAGGALFNNNNNNNKSAFDVDEEDEEVGGPGTTMGNKWQQGGAFAVDERGVVVWGGKARSADDLMELEAGAEALNL